MSVNVALLQHQVDFITATHPRYVGLVGGYRSGKTVAFCHKAIYLASKNIGYRGALLEPTEGMVVRSLQPVMTSVLEELHLPYTFYATTSGKHTHSYVLHFPDGDVEILLGSAENYPRIAGVSLAWFGIDEMDLLDTDTATAAWRMMVSRLTNGNVMQGFTTSTPEGFKWLHWFFEEDIKKEDGSLKDDRRLLRARTKDNPFLDPNYIPTMEAMYPPKLLEAYLEGHFVNLMTGNVYREYDRTLNHTAKTVNDFHISYPLHVGIDFNKGIMATVCAFIDNAKTVWVVDEVWGEENTTTLIKRLKAKYPNRKLLIYPDNTGDNGTGITDVALLRNAGLEVCMSGSTNPPVWDRVNSVAAKLLNGAGHRTLFVNQKTCPHLTKALEQQAIVKGKPDKTNGLDHAPDALGYIIWNRFPIKTETSSQVVITA